MSLKRIQHVLDNADLVLNEQEEIPGVDPYTLDSDMSHAPWFPEWLLPGAEWGDIADTVWEYLIGEFPVQTWLMNMPGGNTPANRLAIIRYFMNPHIPSRFFNSWWLPGSFKFWSSLRQWMMENWDGFGDEIDWENLFPELWNSTDPPGALFQPLFPEGTGPYTPGTDLWLQAFSFIGIPPGSEFGGSINTGTLAARHPKSPYRPGDPNTPQH